MHQAKNIFSLAYSSTGKATKKLFSWGKKGFPAMKGFIRKHKIWSLLILFLLILSLFFLIKTLHKGKDNLSVNFNEVTVTRQDLSSSVTGSSVIEPNAEYSITSLVTGEILEAPFEEGDIVTKGQMMYKIDAETMENTLSSSDISIQKAEQNYQDALDTMADLSIRSSLSGRISAVYVKKGDFVNNGTKIADVISDSQMEIRIPFNESEAAGISPGMNAVLTLVGTGSQLQGTVTAVSNAGEALNGYTRVRYVTILTDNPGALTSGDSATAMIGDIACNDVGTFEPVDSTTILAKTSGTLSSVNIHSGDSVQAGSIVATISSDSADSQLTNARFSLQESQLSRDKILKQLEDYTITAPIEGTVVTKNKKAGETIESGGNSSSASGNSNVLAIIYDMSSLCFQLDVDELDVKKLKIGQEVSITADAVKGKTYTGIVENVSITGTVGTNGVTTYPVKVRINDFDENLLPGMNIEASITVEKAENILVIPSSAVNRGNTVYAKGEKTDENDTAPEGYKTVSVEIGLSNDNYVEITAGLKEGDIIYVAAPTEERQSMMPGMGGMPSGGMHGMGIHGGGMTGRSMPSGGNR